MTKLEMKKPLSGQGELRFTTSSFGQTSVENLNIGKIISLTCEPNGQRE